MVLEEIKKRVEHVNSARRTKGTYSIEARLAFKMVAEDIPTLIKALEMAEKENERLRRPCRACNGQGYLMEYDDSPGELVQNDCGRCKNSGVEPK